MDARVNDFFNEINEIAPPIVGTTSNECVWQECFDETTNYPYYWNVNTNAVTWEMPAEYKDWLDKKSTGKTEIKPLFPSVVESKTITTVRSNLDVQQQDTKKIKALHSYQFDNSDHESNGTNGSASPAQSKHSDTEQAEELKPTLGFTMLASYGNDSDDDDEEEEEQQQAAAEKEPPSSPSSTLFPRTKPIDPNQFLKPKPAADPQPVADEEEIDIKAFKRKRRIGVHLINTHPKRENNDAAKTTNVEETKSDETRKKFGMNFIKGGTLQPEEKDSEEKKHEDDAHSTLKEKLAFLCEGREPASAVQVMLIQLETLCTAWKSGDLNAAYILAWCKQVGEDLVQLEADATPQGWLLEWDRREKRYYYRNKATDACQWDYPTCSTEEMKKKEEEEVVEEVKKTDDEEEEEEDDDAMDICTTPPPADEGGENGNGIEASAKENNVGKNSKEDSNSNHTMEKNEASKDMSLALDSFYSDIAAIETARSHEQQQNEEKERIAVEGNVKKKQQDPGTSANGGNVDNAGSLKENSQEPPKKKKKVKMSTGISMKKKGVSQLVEKWKSVQKDLE